MSNTVLLPLLLSSAYDEIVTADDLGGSFEAEFAPNSFDYEFGQHMARARERASLSQRRVSQALAERGITLDSAALSRLEKGKRSPKLEEAVALAEVLNIPIVEIVPPKPDVMRLARARQNVEKQLDDALYKLSGAAGYLEFFASMVEASPEFAQEVFRDESPAARFDWEAWAVWTIDMLASSPHRRVMSADDERAHAIKRVLQFLANAVVTAPIDLVDASDGVPLGTRKPRPSNGVDQATP